MHFDYLWIIDVQCKKKKTNVTYGCPDVVIHFDPIHRQMLYKGLSHRENPIPEPVSLGTKVT